MKKIISFAVLLLAFLMIPAAKCLAVSAGIDDRAGIYTDSEITELEQRQKEVADLTGWNIAVITTDTGFGTNGVDACDFAEQYYNDTFGADSSSVVYLIDLDYRWIAMDGNVLDHFDSKRFNTMMDACERCYMNYEDVKNLNTFYDSLEKYYLAGTVERDPSVGPLGDAFETSVTNDGISIRKLSVFLLAGLLVSAIVICTIVYRYNTHTTPSANTYLEHGSVDMYKKSDIFSYECTTRTPIRSSSSGGSHHSGSHRSGGRNHGGGGRGGRR